MGTLGFDSYIRDQGNITIPNGSRFPVYPVQQSLDLLTATGKPTGIDFRHNFTWSSQLPTLDKRFCQLPRMTSMANIRLVVVHVIAVFS